MYAEAARVVLKRSLAMLRSFPCPSHHRPFYRRTRQALLYLLGSANLRRVVFLRNSTLAPICAELVPDSGVAFLRGMVRLPGSLAGNLRRDPDAGKLVGSLWEDALGLDFAAWQPLAAAAPVIFVRLGCSRQNPDGRWHWDLLKDIHLEFAYDDAQAAFTDLIDAASRQGDAARVTRLTLFQSSILPD